LNTTKNRFKILGFVAFMLLTLYFFFNPSEFNFFPKCPFHQVTGLHCPGCGSQRALHDIFHFHIIEAASHNLLLIVTLGIGIPLFIFKRKLFFKIIYHTKTPYLFLLFVLVFWILRNLDLPLFSWLSP